MKTIILETKRLQLEIINDHHRKPLYDLLSNETVHRYFPKVLNRNESIEFYERIQTRYRDDGFCYWAVIRKTDKRFIGICGIIKQEIDGEFEAEIGYRLLDSYWCNGYGTEAAKGCVDYAKEILKKSSVISLIRSVNVPSLRVAEKNGFRFEKEIMFHGLPHNLYRLCCKPKIVQ